MHADKEGTKAVLKAYGLLEGYTTYGPGAVDAAMRALWPLVVQDTGVQALLSVAESVGTQMCIDKTGCRCPRCYKEAAR